MRASDLSFCGLMGLAAAVVVSATSVPSAAAQDYYAGKRLSVIVGYAAGGGIDTVTRLFVRHMAAKLAGQPNVIIQNMPGAAGAVAMNYMAQQAPKDGTVINYDAWSPLNQITGVKSIRYDYTKMTLIGALRGGPFIMFARSDIVPGGLKNSADVTKASQLVYGGQQPTLGLDIFGRLGLDVMKLNYKYVSGYKGARAIRTALERGEVNVTTHGLQGYRGGVEPVLVSRGVAKPLWYFQFRNQAGVYADSPLVKDMPAFLEVYRQAHGGKPSGIKWDALELMTTLYGANFVWAPPGLDAKALAPLRKAFYAAASSPEFIADLNRVFKFAYEPVPIAEAEQIIANVSKVSPKLADFFKAFLK